MRLACKRVGDRKTKPGIDRQRAGSKKITMSTVNKYHLDYLDQLETESIHILREVAGQFERPALLFSGGKDSITLVHLALKACEEHIGQLLKIQNRNRSKTTLAGGSMTTPIVEKVSIII